MCENCFLGGVYRFRTWQDFDAFREELLSKPLFPIHRPSSESACEQRQYYQCESCQEVWVLSEPENSWRGYFLPEDVADAYSRKLGKQDKFKRIGCLILLGLFVAFICLKWLVEVYDKLAEAWG